MGKKRIAATAGLMATCFLCLLVRAFDLQVVQGEEIRREMDAKRRHIAVLKAPRGRILDRNGKVLACDERSFDLHVVVADVLKDERVIPRLATLLNKPDIEQAIAKVLSDIDALASKVAPKLRGPRAAYERKAPRLLSSNVDFEAAYQVELHPELYKGLFVRESLRRVYPYGRSAAHVLGYVGKITPDEYKALMQRKYLIDDLDERLGEHGASLVRQRGYLMDELIGRSGVEKSCDAILRGKPGLAIIERDLDHGTREQVDLSVMEPGRDVTLTIDIEFQQKVEAILGELAYSTASVVATAPETGEVLALANKPAFDPNDFIPPTAPGRVRSYFEGENQLLKPMLNRAVSGTFQLGSIFKIFTGLAGLEEGVVQPDEIVECNGKMDESRNSPRCWIFRQHGGTHGPLTIEGALEQSCNIFFYTLGRRLGLAGLSKYAEPLGFGQKTGIKLPGEHKGLFPHPMHWTERDSMTLAIGQSNLLVTPIQVSKALGAIATRGAIIRPRLLLDEPVESSRIEGKYWDAIIGGMLKVTGGQHGTAKGAGMQPWAVAGKTSSAQTVGGRASHAWFAGFAPEKSPQVCVVVLVEHGGAGGETAAPVASKVFEKFFSK